MLNSPDIDKIINSTSGRPSSVLRTITIIEFSSQTKFYTPRFRNSPQVLYLLETSCHPDTFHLKCGMISQLCPKISFLSCFHEVDWITKSYVDSFDTWWGLAYWDINWLDFYQHPRIIEIIMRFGTAKRGKLNFLVSGLLMTTGFRLGLNWNFPVDFSKYTYNLSEIGFCKFRTRWVTIE